MKLNVKSLMLVLGTGIVFSLSGCGGGSSTTTEEPVVESRTDLAHAGEAEFPTGIHYGNTLFDSADKKCQMCHFELYDTWKTSMHSKSWTDGIFQKKYQEYLRVQLSKIGSIDKNTGTTYTTGILVGNKSTNVNNTSAVRTGGGTSRVCLKCHAPGAYYAGDFNISVQQIGGPELYDGKEGSDLQTVLNLLEKDKTSTLNATTVASVGKDGNVYTATYHVGHEANREGINCATCHSIESIRLMGIEGTEGVRDGGELRLKNAIKYGPTGSERFSTGTILEYDSNATNPHMNGFFSLLGPELYNDINDTPQDADGMNDISKKAADGRFTYRSVEINGTNGTHYTGGPFYGPFGITGTNNSNDDDNSSRLASSLGEDKFHALDNHFSKNAKALCLSCHQRSAGAKDPNAVENNQMELCSTWNAMSDGVDDNFLDTASSPKCTKCHMPRLNDKTVLHKWNKPNELFTRDELLTGYFDPEDGDNYGEEHNPVFGKWMNDHGFIGGNRQSGNNFKDKIISGFEADVSAEVNGETLTVSTYLLNKTAHMLPGAHPMRRMLTRVIVTDDETGAMVVYSGAEGNSTFENIVNTVEPSNSNDTINTTGTGRGSVQVKYKEARNIQISGLAPDLSDADVIGQKFANTPHYITAADVIENINNITDTYDVNSTVTNAVIKADDNASTFTRIYGRQTGKIIDDIFIVRPGFDSNTVPDESDNRLVPNEKETYTINYTIDPEKTYTITYKVYYLLTGANGKFPIDPTTGWYDGSDANIYEVYSKQITQ